MSGVGKRPPIILPKDETVLLEELGYKVDRFISSGKYGSVFKGKCNQNASKSYPITEEESHRLDTNNIRRIIRRLEPNGPLIESLYIEKSLEGKYCAIKVLKTNTQQQRDMAAEEAKVMIILSHPNIVEIYNSCSFMPSGNRYIIMEFIDGLTLIQYIKKNSKSEFVFNEWQLKKMINELFDAMIYLHSREVLHRDLHVRECYASKG